jgi:hypothetical protein
VLKLKKNIIIKIQSEVLCYKMAQAPENLINLLVWAAGEQ